MAAMSSSSSGVATYLKSSRWMAKPSTTGSRIAGASSRMIWRKRASVCALLVSPEGVLEERREQPRTKQRPTQLAQRQGVQPLPVAQLQRSRPRVKHHEEDAGQRQRNGQQRGLKSTKAMVGRELSIGHYIISSSAFIDRIKYTGT